MSRNCQPNYKFIIDNEFNLNNRKYSIIINLYLKKKIIIICEKYKQFEDKIS